MTIALGLIAQNGVVVAADTNETRGFMKIDVKKISAMLGTNQTDPTETKARCYVITGSGSGHHLEAIRDQLFACVASNETAPTHKIDNDCAEILKKYYADHILPFALYPEHERPTMSLLIATDSPHNRLLVSQDNAIRNAGPIAAVGIGTIVADQLLGRYYQAPILDVYGVLLLASYVMYHVKDSVEGCGKATDMLGFKDGVFFSLRRDETAALEEAMGQYSRNFEPMMLRRLTAADTAEQQRLSAQARGKINKVIARLKARLMHLHEPAVRG
jgi:hypothetical protein